MIRERSRTGLQLMQIRQKMKPDNQIVGRPESPMVVFLLIKTMKRLEVLPFQEPAEVILAHFSPYHADSFRTI